ERGLALGASAYVTKPFKPEELQTAITHILRK
ncbi:MAG TPA: response regulator, partial [Nitrospiraceae bacterium]|nr:response regulator [Nitrospiraceae bacterium]